MLFLTLFLAAVGVEQNPDDQYVKVGADEAVFTCIANTPDGETISSITWFRKGSSIPITKGLYDDKKLTGNRTATLTISKASNIPMFVEEKRETRLEFLQVVVDRISPDEDNLLLVFGFFANYGLKNQAPNRVGLQNLQFTKTDGKADCENCVV